MNNKNSSFASPYVANKKYVHPLISWSVLFVAFLASVTFAGIYVILSKAEAARDKILVENYRKFTELYAGASVITSIGRIDISFLSKDAPITVRNFSRIADTGVFDNTLFRSDKKSGLLESGLSTQQIDSQVVRAILGRGRSLRDSSGPRKPERGMIAMKFGSEDARPVLAFIVDDDAKVPADFQFFGVVTSGMEYIDSAYEQNVNDGGEDLPVIIRRIDLGDRI